MSAFAHKLPAQVIKAWRIPTCGGTDRRLEGYPLEVEAETLDDALNQTAPRCQHKDNLAILQSHAGKRNNTLRLYAIKQESKAVYRRNPTTGVPEATRRLYPVLLFELAVESFAPVEPWQWQPGMSQAEVLGVDPDLVEDKQ